KLTPQEADEHPQRSIITRALGPEAGVEPDSRTFPARDGDVYLLCSDGLTSMVAEAEVGELLRASPTLADAGRRLVDAANAAGGRDNITVVLFRLEEVVHAGAAAGGERDQTTTSGVAAPHADDVRRAAADAASPEGRRSRQPADETRFSVQRRAPRPPRTATATAPEPRRRRLRIPAGLVVAVFLVGAIVVGFWFASQTVYFVGSSDDGFVTVYRGLPYDLPAGVSLYSVNYESGVPTASLPAGQQRTVTDHKLRSHDDAQDLVRQLETGELRSS
ncbi:MAG TPA: hypothetical protein VLA98_08025, partial [Solirubrobacteraceae bacterium]|nr:hypothetical protein [Solirubrobacteraceae bacterium]